MRTLRSDLAVQVFLVLAAFGGSLLVYVPFFGRMSLVYSFWDGPSYLTMAHDFYHVRPGNPLAPDPTKLPYYSSHLLGYPLLVRALSFIGYQRALLAAVMLSSAVAALFFYRLARDVWKLPSPGFLALVFLFVPPRWMLYRSVGSSEPLYIALILASVYFFETRRYGRASLAAGLASSTRFSGILILPAYALLLLRSKEPRRNLLWLGLIPVGLVLYFIYFISKFKDPLLSIDRNLELISSPVPFWDLTRINSWPARQTSEMYILFTLAYVVGSLRLWKRFPVPFTYCVFQLLFYVLLSGGDWARYYLAMTPFALILGFHDIIETKAFRWSFPVLALLSIYYATKIIPYNNCDIYDIVQAHLGLCNE